MRYFIPLIISFALACGTNPRSPQGEPSSTKQPPATSDRVAASPKLNFNLLEITKNQPKGRVQDNNIEVINQIIEGGKSSVQILIDKLTDETKTKEVFEDYWSYTTVGDVAFIILTDLFTDSTWTKATVPGVEWEIMLGGPQSPNLTGEQYLRNYIAKHGRKAIKVKWQEIWNSYKDKVCWDKTEKCFRLSTE